MKPTRTTQTIELIDDQKRWRTYHETAHGILATIFNRWGIDDDELKDELAQRAMVEVVLPAVDNYAKAVARDLAARHKPEHNFVSGALWNRLEDMVTHERKRRTNYRSNVSVRSEAWDRLVPLPNRKDVDRRIFDAAPEDVNPVRLLIQDKVRQTIRQREEELGRPLDEFEKFEVEAEFDRFDELVWLRGHRMPNVEVAACMDVSEATIRNWLQTLNEQIRIKERITDRLRDRERGAVHWDIDDPIFAETAPVLFEWDDHRELCARFTHHELESALIEWAEDAIRCEEMLSEIDALRN